MKHHMTIMKKTQTNKHKEWNRKGQ